MPMFKYVALAWSEDSELEKATVEMLHRQMASNALPWIVALDCPGLRVYCHGMRKGSSTVYPLPDGTGAILGTLFRRQAGSALPTLSIKDAQDLHASGGVNLVDQYWGRYVAFFRSAGSRTIRVLK